MTAILRILMLEDSTADAELNMRTLRQAGLTFEARRVQHRDAFAEALETFSPDAVLADFSLPNFDGLDALALLRQRYRHIPFIFVTGVMGEDMAVESLRQGANDYILKDRLARLPAALERSIEDCCRAEKLRVLEANLVQAQAISHLGSWHVVFGDNEASDQWTVSQEFRRLLGVTTSASIATASMFECVTTEDVGRVRQAWQAAKRTNGPREWEYRVLVDGSIRWFHIRMRVSFSPSGRATTAEGIIQDVSERRTTDEYVRQAAAVFESTREGIVITDLSGTIRAVNPAFSLISGFGKAEAVGINMRELQSGRHGHDFYHALWSDIANSGHWQGEIWNRRKSGEIYPAWLTISAVNNELGEPVSYVGVFTDITRIKQSEAKLEHLAHYDALTGLPNRLLLNSRLDHAMERARRNHTHGAVLFLDLDHFKNVNDSLGHPAGDELLSVVASRLRHRLRDSDTVARLGGDEFVVVLEDIGMPEHAANVAHNLLGEIHQPYHLSSGHTVYIGASIGISLFPEDAISVETLIRFADIALYQAKDGGRGAIHFYTESLGAQVQERRTLELSLRRALDQEEFVLHYQPLVSLTDDNQSIGMEALVRWQCPAQGLILPNRFIPLAEDTGLIIPLGEWVLRAACAQARKWLDAGMPLTTIAVNISPRQFRQENLVERVAAILEETKLPPRILELELTEGALAEHGGKAESRLGALKALGLRLAIDDFGTGYSSLAYLKRFPVDKLKIDKSFVRDIPGDTADREIVATIIAMAKNLKLDVLAEGVETEEQLAFLKQYGCDYGQGFHFGRPVPARAFQLPENTLLA